MGYGNGKNMVSVCMKLCMVMLGETAEVDLGRQIMYQMQKMYIKKTLYRAS